MGMIIKKQKRFDFSNYNFAYVNPSAAHTYGNVTSVIVNYLKSLFGDNYFKYIHVSTKIAYKEFDFRKNTQKEFFKKQTPMLVIKPRVVLDDGDFFMSNSPLTKKMTDNFYICEKGDLMPFFHDDKKNIFIKYALNRMCMEFDVMIILDTVMEQLNAVNGFKNRVRQDMNFNLETALEAFIPQNIIDLLSHNSGIPVFDENNKVKRFLDYMNCHSGFPITYKLKGSSNRDEFFRYYNAKLDTKISGLQFDEGSKKNMINDMATITFDLRTEFWGTGMYYYFTLEELPEIKEELPTNKVELFSTKIYKSIGLPEGYKVYTTAAFKTEPNSHEKEDSISIDSLINSEIEQLIKYCNYSGTSIEPFIKLIILEDGNVLEDDDFTFDLNSREVTIKKSNRLATYRIYVYINQLFLNNFMVDIINSDLDTHKISVDSSGKSNAYDVDLPPHYGITDSAIVDQESTLIYDKPNLKPISNGKDYDVYVGKISSSVPNNRNIDRDYVIQKNKADEDTISVIAEDIINKYLIICFPEEFRNVVSVYNAKNPTKNIRNQFNIGYIQIGGRDYKYYMLGKDMIGHIELIFKFTI